MSRIRLQRQLVASGTEDDLLAIDADGYREGQVGVRFRAAPVTPGSLAAAALSPAGLNDEEIAAASSVSAG